jgi:[ribosomal protein S18]-alanine N-acetyltransferase
VKVCLLEPKDSHAKVGVEIQLARIRRLLEQLGHQVVVVVSSANLYAELRRQRLDVVFNLASVEGSGESHLIPAIIEMTGLCYTGSGVLSLSLGTSYARLFPILFTAGIPLPPFRILKQTDRQHELRYPLVLYRESGRHGSIIANDEALTDRLRLAGSHEQLLLVEQINGPKVSLFALGQEPLFSHPESEIGSFVKKTCQLIEARGLVQFDFVRADRPTLVGVDTLPDPLDAELLCQAASTGWDELELLRALLDHAGCDSNVAREQIIIRPITLTDSELKRLLEIESASFVTDAYQIEDFRQVYLKCSELSVVAVIGGQIAGYMMTRRLFDRGDIFSIAVAPAYRRKDIGAALFRYTVNRLNEWGIARIELEVRKTNEAGASFWRRMGFEPVSTIPNFYEDGSEALMMRKEQTC